ncbi:MAG TPA: VOC family protein [Ohtaekwangia sp.]|uniref:VOC family protein n=1 Tax=Ohtaekwangia sp. TaxID=2066019 RepID=UPI002F937FD1
MAAINPYLSFNSNCEEVFNFYRSVFGGDFLTVMRFKEMAPYHPVDKAEENLVMHMALPIGHGTVLMGSDTPASMGKVNNGNNIGIAIQPDSKQEADRLFNGLSAGGTVTMPMGDAFWGAYFGMFTDKFGINWMVNYDANQRP